MNTSLRKPHDGMMALRLGEKLLLCAPSFGASQAVV